MVATREQLDQLINEHFMFEATDNLDGVMGSLADDIRHEVIPSRYGELTDKQRIRAFYTDLFANLRDGQPTPLARYYGDNFVIDETLWTGNVVDGSPLLVDGKAGEASFRLLHVFEVEDGKITKEQVWIDLAALQGQLKPKN